jgi:hypothetical protein
VVETTSIELACGGFEVFETKERNKFRVHLTPVKMDVLLSGSDDISVGFTEQSPIELMNKANLRVFATDYDNYAGAVECKNADGLFYISATIASRTGVLSDEIVEKLKQQLTSQGVDVSGFKVIRQDIC